MKNILGKLHIVCILSLCLCIFNNITIFAYNEDEKQDIKYDNRVQNIEEQLEKQNKYKKGYSQKEFTVVIDAGHGGKDSGAVNKSLKMYEKNLNLDIAKAIEKRLKYLGINVVMTRNTDVFVELAERSAMANSIGADLFVSVHNDTPEGNGDGAHIIHSVFDNNSGISKSLATEIGNSIKFKTSQNLRKYNPVWSRYSSDKTTDYYAVIRQTKMPSVIIEHAYMNSNDIKAIDTLEERNAMGIAVADGIFEAITKNFNGWMKFKDTWKYYNLANKSQSMGWELINGLWYYFENNGLMAIGWNKVDGKWYFLNSNGEMAKGWKKVDGKWYFLNSSGDMAKGWKKVDGKWYFLNSSGDMVTGWKQVDGKWYFLNSSGEMAIGWKQVDDNLYYLLPDGVMVTGEVVIDGNTYIFNSSGAKIK